MDASIHGFIQPPGADSAFFFDDIILELWHGGKIHVILLLEHASNNLLIQTPPEQTLHLFCFPWLIGEPSHGGKIHVISFYEHASRHSLSNHMFDANNDRSIYGWFAHLKMMQKFVVTLIAILSVFSIRLLCSSHECSVLHTIELDALILRNRAQY